MSADWRGDAASADPRVELAAVLLFALGVAAIARMLYRAGLLG
jgi:hypothetical protein